MKVLIQNPNTLLYLESADRWSCDIKSAFDFRSSDEAIAFCAENRIAPIQVVLQWEGRPYSLIIPVATQRAAHQEKAHRARKHA